MIPGFSGDEVWSRDGAFFPLNQSSLLTSFQIIIDQINRQRAVLCSDRIPYFSHAALAIDKIYDLVGVEFREILRIQQWRSFAVQQLDFRHALGREACLKNVVILIGKRPEVADADGNLPRPCLSCPNCLRLRALCSSGFGLIVDPRAESYHLTGESFLGRRIVRGRAGKLEQ